MTAVTRGAIAALSSPPSAPAAPPVAEGAPISAGHAANHPLIRRILLDAWHDLKWYRVNAKEHPGHAGRTVEALQAALKSGDDVLAASASAPESAPRAASAPAMAPAAGEETAREHYAKIAEECAGAKFAAECSTETHNMACESIAQAIRQCDHVPAPGASRAPADAAGTCIFCSIWDRYTQGILMAWSERAEDDDEREEIVAWRQKVRTLATRAPASASPTSSDADAAEPARETGA